MQWWALWVISLSPPPSLGSSPVVSRHFRYNDDNNHEIGAFISRLSDCGNDDEILPEWYFISTYLQVVSKTNYVELHSFFYPGTTRICTHKRKLHRFSLIYLLFLSVNSICRNGQLCRISESLNIDFQPN